MKTQNFHLSIKAAAIVFLLAAVSLQSCTPAPAAIEAEQTYPADWTANPTAGVVLEPIDE